MKKMLEKKLKSGINSRDLRKKPTENRCKMMRKLKSAKRQIKLSLSASNLKKRNRIAVPRPMRLKSKNVGTHKMMMIDVKLRKKLPKNYMKVFKRKKSLLTRTACKRKP